MSCTGIRACGESSSGSGEILSETALVEAGTRCWIWLVPIWVDSGQRINFELSIDESWALLHFLEAYRETLDTLRETDPRLKRIVLEEEE